MITMRKALVVAAALALAGHAVAQQPERQPRGSAKAMVGGKGVSVDYGRPALKGRSLDELLKQLPPDRVWRAGENQVTTLTTEGAISVGGKTVPAGKYSVYVHAGEANVWDLILNRDPGVPLGKVWAQAPDNMKNEPWPNLAGGYKPIEASEVARARMAAASSAASADVFTISLTPSGTGAILTMAWGTQAFTVALQPAK